MADVMAIDLRETPFGLLPGDWNVMPLSDCAQVQTGVAKGRKLNSTEIITVPYLRVANVQDGFLDLSEIKSIDIRKSELNRYSLQTGDVLLTEGGDFDKLGRGFVWSGELPRCVHQNHIFAVRADRHILEPAYLAYLIQSSYGKSYFLTVAHKTTNLACINTTKLKAFPVSVPPLKEQRAIAHILRTVQRAKEATEKVIAATRQLKTSMMRHLFTYGPVPVADADQVETRESELGLIPRDWNTGRLRDLATKITKGSSPKWQGYDYCVAGTTFVRSQNIGWGRLDLSEVAHLPESFNESHNGSVVKSKDVLVNLVGASIGRVAMADERIEGANLNQAVGIVRLKGELEPQFLVSFLLSESGQHQIHTKKKEIARANISLQDLRNLEIPTPDLIVQRKIADAARAPEEKEAAELSRHTALDQLFSSLQNHLMTGKLRVRDLDPTDHSHDGTAA